MLSGPSRSNSKSRSSCASSSNQKDEGAEICGVCLDEAVSGEAGVVALGCGHCYHEECLHGQLQSGLPEYGRLDVNLWDCAACRRPMENTPPVLESQRVEGLLKSVREMRMDLTRLVAEERSSKRGASASSSSSSASSSSSSSPPPVAKYAFYRCGTCASPYIGGKISCLGEGPIQNQDQSEPPDQNQINEAGRIQTNDPQPTGREEFQCPPCKRALVRCQEREAHKSFHVNKCRFCCSVAVWFCYGTTSFCAPCHNDAGRLQSTHAGALPRCPGPSQCPLGIAHPPHGHEHAIGCTVCQALHDITSPQALQKLKREQQYLLQRERLRDHLLLLLLAMWVALFAVLAHRSAPFLFSLLRQLGGLVDTLLHLAILLTPHAAAAGALAIAVTHHRLATRRRYAIAAVSLATCVCIPLEFLLTNPGHSLALPSASWIPHSLGFLGLVRLLRGAVFGLCRVSAPMMLATVVLFLAVKKPVWHRNQAFGIALFSSLSVTLEAIAWLWGAPAGSAHLYSVVSCLVHLEIVALSTYSVYSLILLYLHSLKPHLLLWRFSVYINCSDVCFSSSSSKSKASTYFFSVLY